MRASTHSRGALFRQIAGCLVRMSEAADASSAVEALAGFLVDLPLAWFTVDAYQHGRIGRRAASSRCPRGFAPFLIRLGFLSRQDGTYQGVFGDSVLLLVKVGAEGHGLVSAVGLPKGSPLDDGAVLACLSALMRTSLLRAIDLDTDACRRAMIEASLATPHEWLGLFEADGTLVEQYPPGAARPALPDIGTLWSGRRRRHRPAQTLATAGGGQVTLDSRPLAGSPLLDRRYLVVRTRATPVASPLVADRLQRYGLSQREFQVAELLFAGQTNRRIAEALFISRDTVKTHCKHIFGKLGITRRTEILRVLGGP